MTLTAKQGVVRAGMVVLGWLWSMHCVAGPVTIDYEVSALGAPGRYEYRYTVSNVSLATPLSWFSIDFDPALYDDTSLTISSVGLGNWSEQILGSVLPGAPAQYDAYKTIGSGLGIGDSESGFAVEFTWLGTGTPGSQAFILYDPGTLDLLGTGVTSAAGTPPTGVPEPSSAGLALNALLALCAVTAARRRTRPIAETTQTA